MEKHKFASISLTVRDREISSKFSTHGLSEKCTLGNFQKIFPSLKMAAILNFRIFGKNGKTQFYCVYTSYPMDNMLSRSAQTGPPNVRKRRPVFPPAGWSSHCTRQVAHCTSFLSRQPDVIASFSFGACTACTDYFVFGTFFIFCEITEVYCFTTLLFTSSHIIDHYVLS